MRIAATRAGRADQHTRTVELRTPAGTVCGTMRIANAAAIGPTLDAACAAAAAWRRVPVLDRIEIVERAGAALNSATLSIGDEAYTREDSVRCVSALTGMPECVVREGYRALANDLAHAGAVLRAASPTGDLSYYENPLDTRRDTQVQWVPVGDALAVVAPGNVVPVHGMWAVLVAAGFPMVVKPSASDPYTPARVVAALVKAGAPPELLSVLPLDGADVSTLTQLAPAAIAFGDEVTLARLPNVTRAYGPGRSLSIVSDATLQDAAVRAEVRHSIVADAGRGCINTSVLAVVGGGDAGLQMLAQELGALAPCPLNDPKAVLGVLPDDAAHAWAARLDAAVAEGGVDFCAAYRSGGRISPTKEGACLLPAVIEVAPDAPACRWEVPAPAVWVVRWPEAVLDDGLLALEGYAPEALVASQFVESEALFASLCAHPGIGKAYLGLPTTCMEPHLPHVGFVTDGLFIAKAVRRA